VPRVLVAVLLVLGSAVGSLAGELDIVADRPGFGESASVVGTGRIQAETGLTWIRVDSPTSVFDLPEALVRVGLGRSVELRVTAPNWLRTRANEGSSSGWSDMAVGLKVHVAAGQSDLAFRGTVYLATGSGALTADRAEPEVALAWSRALDARWSLAATLSARRLRLLHQTLTSPSVSLGRALGERVATFVEYGANLARDTQTLHRLDHGYTWLLSPHTQLDASLGVGLSSAAPDFFVAIGYCRRF
jgi:Putative MetA-pathway of phenol degradation